MKAPWKWKENDLLNLIKHTWKESVDLEFKGHGALENTEKKKYEISKDVSAMANSAGGTIIYGILENGHVATGLDRGFDPKTTTKEWLEQVINSRIHRRVDGIKINQVDLAKTQPGTVVYVVNIPSSMRAPHQAGNKKFYKRFNFESVPMEEYEIRDVSRRMLKPALKLKIDLLSTKVSFKKGNKYSEPIRLNATITNEGEETAEYAVIQLMIDSRLSIVNRGGMSVAGDAVWSYGGKEIKSVILSLNWALPSKLPIFKGINFRITESDIQVGIPLSDKRKKTEYLVGYTVQAPRMTRVTGYSIIRKKLSKLKVSNI